MRVLNNRIVRLILPGEKEDGEEAEEQEEEEEDEGEVNAAPLDKSLLLSRPLKTQQSDR